MEPRDNERELLRLGWRLDALDEWRKVTVDPGLGSLRKDVDRMAKTDEIATAVADQLGKHRARMYTTGEKIVGIIVSICAIGSFLASVIK